MKKILLLEPDQGQAELLVSWLKGEAYGVSLIDKPQAAQSFLANDEFELFLMDCDDPEITAKSLELARMLKADMRFKDLPVIVIAYRKDTKKIIDAVEAGIDLFMLKPFETDSFLERIKDIFKEIELKSKGNKMLNLNYINYLIELASQMERGDFFALARVIFNKLIIEKTGIILGPQIIAQIVKRVNETIGADYEFMRSIEFSGKGLSLDGVDKVSRDVPTKKIAIAYRDYVYAFVHIVMVLTSDILAERGGVFGDGGRGT